MKTKGKMSLMLVLIALAVVPMVISCIAINILASMSIESMVTDEIESKLHATVEATAQHFYEMADSGDGSWIMDGDTLKIGGHELAPDDDFFSSALSEDVYLTLFYGDTRYGTSIKNEAGELVTGTQAAEQVIADVLEGGNTKFIKHVEVVGQDFSGYYIPLTDNNNEIVGMMFAGSPYADTEKEMNKTLTTLIISVIVCILVFGAIATFVAIMINKAIKSVVSSIDTISSGDFSTPIENRNKIRELHQIAENMEGMRSKIHDILLQIIQHANSVDEGANLTEQKISDSQDMASSINSAVSDLAQGATAMANSVQDASNLTQSIGESVNRVLDSAASNIEMADAVYNNSIHVQKQIEHLKAEDKETDAMAGEVQNSVSETAKGVEEISRAAEAIINIASETNLLALNASIESARAGESGKGFAVVANNIKDLAEESDKSANEITAMLSRISALSDQNMRLTQTIKEATGNESVAFDNMSAAFDDMEHQLEESEEANKQIKELVESVNRDKEAIMDAVDSLSSISEENAASTEETSAALTQLTDNMMSVVDQARELKDIANRLKDSISFFRV